MNKRIHCSDCPLCNVAVDTLCEEYCSDMAEFVDEIRAEAYQKGKLDGVCEFAEWLKKSHWRIDLSEALKEWQKGAENDTI